MSLILQVFCDRNWKNYDIISGYNIEYYTNYKIKQSDIKDISIIATPNIKSHANCYIHQEYIPKCFVNRSIITLKPHCKKYKSIKKKLKHLSSKICHKSNL